jgi:hypothetical protein
LLRRTPRARNSPDPDRERGVDERGVGTASKFGVMAGGGRDLDEGRAVILHCHLLSL